VSEEDWPSERPQRVGLILTKPGAFKALFPSGLDALRISDSSPDPDILPEASGSHLATP
jgi:hypothetical protein